MEDTDTPGPVDAEQALRTAMRAAWRAFEARVRADEEPEGTSAETVLEQTLDAMRDDLLGWLEG